MISMEYGIVRFDSTHAALKFEALCKERGLSGRIIPTPPLFTTSCGLSWRYEMKDHDVIAALCKAYDTSPYEPIPLPSKE